MGVYQVCSNKSPWVNIGPTPGAYPKPKCILAASLQQGCGKLVASLKQMYKLAVSLAQACASQHRLPR